VSKLNRFSTVLSEANSIIRSIRSYPKRRRTQRLYKQWAERDGLQPEVLSVEGVKTEDAPLQVVNANSLSGMAWQPLGEWLHRIIQWQTQG